MGLDRVTIVLVEPSHPGNIGATARAMKNMGLYRLHLVAPHQFPHAEASSRASGAADLLAAARVLPDLPSALTGTDWVVGSTARDREISAPFQEPGPAAADMMRQAAAGREVALLFGRESSGLTNEELDLCDALVGIPAAEDYASLNLAQAVQILAYELFLAARDGPAGTAAEDELPAGGEVTEGLFGHFERVLRDVGFAKPRSEKRTFRRLRRLLLRARPTAAEVDFLRGVLSAVEKRIHGPTPRNGTGSRTGEAGKGRKN